MNDITLKVGQWVKCIQGSEIKGSGDYILKLELNRYYKILRIMFPDFKSHKIGNLYFPKYVDYIWFTISVDDVKHEIDGFCLPLLVSNTGKIISEQYFDISNPLDYNPHEVV